MAAASTSASDAPPSEAGAGIFIAIDFGTTYSGYAFAVGKEGPRRNDISVQPSNDGRKEPTFVLINASDTSLDSFGQEAWSKYVDMLIQADDDDEESERDISSYLAFDRFKMGLQHDEEVSGEMKIQARNSDRCLPARIVFGRSLEYFYKKIKKVLVQSLLGGNLEEGWERIKDEVQWIITAPAIWGQRARQFMKKAAIEAGMETEATEGKILIELEPEGAALFCRKDLMHRLRMLGHPKELCYMVVDCGGGTVDVTIHKMDRDTKKIREVHQATGGPWGGTTVDNEVKKFIERVIGEDIAQQLTDEDWLELTRKTLQEAKQKTSSGDGMQKVTLHLPTAFCTTLKSKGVNLEESFQSVDGVKFRPRHGALVFESWRFRNFFDSSLRNISDHIRALLRNRREVSCILLVGGYAESLYLRNHLKTKFDSTTCSVISPVGASLSILKGAVMYGQNPKIIEERVSSRSYGIRCLPLFNPRKHPANLKKQYGGQDRCDNVYDEIIKVGQVVRSGRPFQKVYSPVEANQPDMRLKIFSLEEAVEYTTGLRPLAKLVVPMVPNEEKGINRSVRLQIDFSQTQLFFTACDEDGSERRIVKVNFL